jgi:hypothetical protein
MLTAIAGFVVAYSIQAIVWLFVYCTPFSGWWEFQWMNPFDPRCADFNLFVNLVYWNICEFTPSTVSPQAILTPDSLQHLHRCGPGRTSHPHHLEPQDEASRTALRDWHSQSGISVS